MVVELCVQEGEQEVEKEVVEVERELYSTVVVIVWVWKVHGGRVLLHAADRRLWQGSKHGYFAES